MVRQHPGPVSLHFPSAFSINNNKLFLRHSLSIKYVNIRLTQKEATLLPSPTRNWTNILSDTNISETLLLSRKNTQWGFCYLKCSNGTHQQCWTICYLTSERTFMNQNAWISCNAVSVDIPFNKQWRFQENLPSEWLNLARWHSSTWLCVTM